MTSPLTKSDLTTGWTSSLEWTTRCLDRISAADPELRAVIATDPDALSFAAEADRRRAAGRSLGPLDGVPLLVKDNIDTAGLPCTVGSRLLADLPAPPDAAVVGRLRAAGAIVLGKTNLSEWGYLRSAALPEGWSSVGGQTRNPHDPKRSAWGSSSGSAVAVAAGMVPLALGTETDGSIVGPAGMTGVIGLKPETGLLPLDGIAPLSPTTDVPGVLAATLEDAALCLAVMAGTDPVPGRPADLEGLRLGVWRVPGMPAAADAVLDSAVARLGSAGAVPVAVDTGVDEGTQIVAGFGRLAEFAEAIPGYLRARGSELTSVADLVLANRTDEVAQGVLERAAGLDADERALALAESARVRKAAKAKLAELRDTGVHAVLAATNPPAWELADGDPPALPASSTPAALAGAAAVSLPAGTVDGLPIGLSVFGPPTVRALLPVALAIQRCLRSETTGGGKCRRLQGSR